jgi:hypothetical protein
MPTAIPVTAEFMNYASVVFFAFFIIATAWYFAWGKKNYQGPPRGAEGECGVPSNERMNIWLCDEDQWKWLRRGIGGIYQVVSLYARVSVNIRG